MYSNKKIILVTGANGFIASNFISSLTSFNKIKLITISRYDFKKEIILSDHLHIKSDISNTIKIFKKLKNFKHIDLLFHFAWDTKNYSKKNQYDSYINSKIFLIKMNQLFVVKQNIIAGTCLEESLSKRYHYLKFYKSKLRTILKRNKVNLCWLKIFFVYGPQIKNNIFYYLLENLKLKKNIIINTPECSYDYIHINDVSSLLSKLVSSKIHLEEIHIGNGKAIKIKSLVKVFLSYFPEAIRKNGVKFKDQDQNEIECLKATKKLIPNSNNSKRISLKIGIKSLINRNL